MVKERRTVDFQNKCVHANLLYIFCLCVYHVFNVKLFCLIDSIVFVRTATAVTSFGFVRNRKVV